MSCDLDSQAAARLHAALDDAAQRSDGDFTGISVVVCNELKGLPYYPMNEGWPIDASQSLADTLLLLSSARSSYHDGFHILSTDFEFLKVACYLAPPIPNEKPRVSFSGRGSRFSTAYFMSLLDQVVCVGIVSNQRDVVVFKQGIKFLQPSQRLPMFSIKPAGAKSLQLT